MYSATTLDIVGFREQAVPHTFFRQDDETRHLAILFPGLGYTTHMPLLFYPARLLLAQGADVLRVEYAYKQQAGFLTQPAGERNRWFIGDVSAACDAGLAQRPYDQITLVGKSMGTLAMGHLLTADERLRGARCVWLTPLLQHDQWRAQVKQVEHRALFCTGTADPHYDAACLDKVQQATRGSSIVVDGANHSLEIEGEVLRSIQVLERVMEGMQEFLGK